MAPLRDPTGMGYGIATPEETEVIDEAQHEHAVEAADDGARLAREHGAQAESLSATEGGNLADTIAAIADERDACAIVVGSRGLGGFKARLLGSTSRDMLHRTRRPVLVVKAPE
jgi:nucleotide-binding universal stress UspA family protein